MPRRTVWLTLLFVALVTLVVSAVLAFGGEPEPIRVGVVYNTSGGMKWLDEPGLEGVRLAAGQINAEGGVLGRRIEVEARDGTTDVVKMTRLAEELANGEDVVAIAGVNEPLHAVAPVRATIKRADGGFLTFSHSEVAVAVGRVAQEAGVPFVTAGSTDGGLPELVGDAVFMTATSHETSAAAVARFAWEELEGRGAWILADDRSEYATGMAGAFESTWEGLGGEVTDDGYVPGAVIQISDQINRFLGLSPSPDVIFIASMPNDGGYLLDQLREAGVTQPILFADVVDPRYIEAMGGDMRDVYMATHGSLDDPDEAVREFVTAFSAEYGKAPESASAMLGYDSLLLIADALERAGSASRDDLRRALEETTDLAAITGPLSYPDGGHVPSKSITIVGYGESGPGVVAKVPSD